MGAGDPPAVVAGDVVGTVDTSKIQLAKDNAKESAANVPTSAFTLTTVKPEITEAREGASSAFRNKPAT